MSNANCNSAATATRVAAPDSIAKGHHHQVQVQSFHTPATPRSVGGCGDTDANIRTPVPSCRKFTTTTSKTRHASNKITADKVATSLQQLQLLNSKILLPKRRKSIKQKPSVTSSAKKERVKIYTSRRSVTMNDIKYMRKNHENGETLFKASPRRSLRLAEVSQDAAKRVAHVLILNAWRRCRRNAATLVETVACFKQQTEQANLQIVTLQELVNSDVRRNAMAFDNMRLAQAEADAARKEAQQVQEQLKIANARIVELEPQFASAKTEALNAQNELRTTKDTCKSLERQLERQRTMETTLRKDIATFKDKVKHNEEQIFIKEIEIETLKVDCAELEYNVEQETKRNKENEFELNKIKRKLQTLEKCNKILECELKISRHNAEQKDIELERSNADYARAREACAQSERHLREIQSAVVAYASRPWWCTLTDLAWLTLGALHAVASVALPALPPPAPQFTPLALPDVLQVQIAQQPSIMAIDDEKHNAVLDNGKGEISAINCYKFNKKVSGSKIVNEESDRNNNEEDSENINEMTNTEN